MKKYDRTDVNNNLTVEQLGEDFLVKQNVMELLKFIIESMPIDEIKEKFNVKTIEDNFNNSIEIKSSIKI